MPLSTGQAPSRASCPQGRPRLLTRRVRSQKPAAEGRVCWRYRAPRGAASGGDQFNARTRTDS